MDKIPFDLTDLVPKKTSFKLSATPDKSFTLCNWSLRVRSWATAKWTSRGLQDIFEKQKIEQIAEMAWFMLEEKAFFDDDQVKFFDAIITIQDQINVIMALLGSVGIGEPEVKKISEAMKAAGLETAAPAKGGPKDPKSKAPRPKKTGAKSSTP